MRGASWSPGILSFALLCGACGGGDLTLPGPGSPATLTIIAGDGQSGSQGQPLADPLVVEVQDGEGRPLAGTTVAFRFTDELPDALVDPGTAPTDSEGHAAAHAQLGRRTGSQAIEAEVPGPGQDLRLRFQLTAMADDPPPGGGGGGNGGGGGHDSSPPPAPNPPPSGGGGDGGGDGHGHGHGDHGDGGNGHGEDH